MTKKKKPIKPIELKDSPSSSRRGEITENDVKPVESFEEGLDRILKKFNFPAETRREIFSQLNKLTERQSKNGQRSTMILKPPSRSS